MKIQRAGVEVPGWEEVTGANPYFRLIVNGRGEDRDGKTQFGLTAPEPVAVFPFDNNTRSTAEKYKKLTGKRIIMPQMDLSYKHCTKKEEWGVVWDKFFELWKSAVTNNVIRSMMADTYTEVYALCRLKEFGKLANVKSHHYDVVNAEMKKLIDMVYDTKKNLYLVHQLADEYINDKKTGNRILAGFKPVPYKVQINILCWRDLTPVENGGYRDVANGIEGFGITVENCSQNEAVANSVLVEPNNTWADLGMLVYPESKESDWV